MPEDDQPDAKLTGGLFLRLPEALETRLNAYVIKGRSRQDIIRAGTIAELDRLAVQAPGIDPETATLVEQARRLGLNLPEILKRELARAA